MGRYNYSFLKKEHTPLWELVQEAESNLQISPRTSLMIQRQIIEYMLKKITVSEGSSYNSIHSAIEEIKSYSTFPDNFINVFHKIRVSGNHANHNLLNEITVASELFNSLFEPLCWFAITYGMEDYLKYASEMNIEEKVVFQYYLLSHQVLLLNNPSIKAILNEVDSNHKFINAFDLGEIEIVSPKFDAFSKYEKDVFETHEEFERRIAKCPPITIGVRIGCPVPTKDKQ
jgi:hypothetical protein